MIELTRLNGHPMVVNSDLIKHAEAIPDTTLTLVTGEKLVVLESCAQVTARILRYRAHVLAEAWPSAETAIAAHNALRLAIDAERRAND
ncbi:flagellar FlbD family protein [Terriglobus roseus]|uniref:Flagellar protein FlbD n=1 Tax=Terriglobus roseus TaxID=392734 RepID=A0A1H4J866_9BACT|nr:flagellar FlbD family protein [Terriglobus roseus]SEB42504.1 flagellar protein FlbD [Terriglobus roseus]